MSDSNSQSAADLLLSPVDAVHEEMGATFAPFGGWRMPVSYAGVVVEHTAVRETVGLFDVSHLGKAIVRGPGAAEFVNSALTNDLGRIAPGQAQYTLCCNETGGVIDDLIAYFVGPDEVFLVPNAANTAAVVAALAAVAPTVITVTDLHREFGVLAVQGPQSAEVLAELGLPADMDYMAFVDAQWADADGPVPVRVCRTGYTGEHGYELIPRWADAERLFRALRGAVEARGGQVAGLGARDTLRTEMGYPLHGHELSPEISPLQARCGWAVGWSKPQFVGRDALLREKQDGPARRLWGLKATGRGVPRADLAVHALGPDESVTGEIGRCTSGTFSPTLKVGIALALIDASAGVAAGDRVSVDVRGRSLVCEVVAPPFVPSHTR